MFFIFDRVRVIANLWMTSSFTRSLSCSWLFGAPLWLPKVSASFTFALWSFLQISSNGLIDHLYLYEFFKLRPVCVKMLEGGTNGWLSEF